MGFKNFASSVVTGLAENVLKSEEFKNFGGPGSGRYPAGSGDKENLSKGKTIDKKFPGHKYTVKIDGEYNHVRNIFPMNSKPDGTGTEGYGVETKDKYNKWYSKEKVSDIRKVVD